MSEPNPEPERNPSPEDEAPRARRHGAGAPRPPEGRAKSPLLALGAAALGLGALAGATFFLDSVMRSRPAPMGSELSAPAAAAPAPARLEAPAAAPAAAPRSSLDMVRPDAPPEPAPTSAMSDLLAPAAQAPAPAAAPAPKAFAPPRLQTRSGSGVQSWYKADQEPSTTGAAYTAQDPAAQGREAAAPERARAPRGAAGTMGAGPDQRAVQRRRDVRSSSSAQRMGQGYQVTQQGTRYQPPAAPAARVATRAGRRLRIFSCREGYGPVPNQNACCVLGGFFSTAARACSRTQAECETQGGGCMAVTSPEWWQDLGPVEAPNCPTSQAALESGACCPRDTWTFRGAARCYSGQDDCLRDAGGMHCSRLDGSSR